jgi:hypothetical protein
MCRQVSLASRGGVVASVVHAEDDIQLECAPDTAKTSLYFRILLGERGLGGRYLEVESSESEVLGLGMKRGTSAWP